MEVKLHSFFVLFLPSHLTEKFFTKIFNFNEFIFVHAVSIRLICDGEIYLLNHASKYLNKTKLCLKRLNTTHFFIMKISNKQELQQIATNNTSEINFDVFKGYIEILL